MGKKLAVAVIHGIGNQGEARPVDSSQSTFSAPLRKSIRREIGGRKFDRQIAWREIFWADILLPRQMRYLDAIRPKVNYDSIREFILCNVADAAVYKRIEGVDDDAYSQINGRVADTVAELNADTSDQTPLIVLAHSFGSHIISSYISDTQQGRNDGGNHFQRMETVGGLITFGSNIPIFLFAFEPEDIIPISFPGTALPNERRAQPWWLNYYDKDDALAFPLREAAPRYQEMVDGGEIDERAIEVGGFFTGWNPAVHNRYWRDRAFSRHAGAFMKQFL